MVAPPYYLSATPYNERLCISTERMLIRAKKVQRLIPDPRDKPKTILRKHMYAADKYHQEICQTTMEGLTKINPKDPQLKYWYSEMVKASERAIDCAHKLAPYEHAKLESMEVKQTIEHRMVMRAPTKIKSVEEWAKITGASVAQLDENAAKERELHKPAESIHDYDETLDQLETINQLKH